MIDWNKPLLLHCSDTQCDLLKSDVCSPHFGERGWLVGFTRSDGAYQVCWVNADGVALQGRSPFVRNVPPQPVTVQLFINYYPDNGTSFIYRSESAAQTHADRTARGVVIAYPVEIKYTPE